MLYSLQKLSPLLPRKRRLWWSAVLLRLYLRWKKFRRTWLTNVNPCTGVFSCYLKESWEVSAGSLLTGCLITLCVGDSSPLIFPLLALPILLHKLYPMLAYKFEESSASVAGCSPVRQTCVSAPAMGHRPFLGLVRYCFLSGMWYGMPPCILPLTQCPVFTPMTSWEQCFGHSLFK